MARGRRIAAAVLMAVALSAGGAATALGLSLPGTTTTLTTPSVSVPTVSTPVATTPSVTVPSTTTKATTPPVSTSPPTSTTTPTHTSTPGATIQSGSTKVTIGGSGGGGGAGGGGSTGNVGGTVKTVTDTLSSGSTGGRTGSRSGSTTPSNSGGGYGGTGSGDSAIAPALGGTTGGPGGGLTSPGGIVGLGTFTGGGPGSPGVLAFGMHRGLAGPGGWGSGAVDAFTAAVASLAGCFYSLTPFEQQVLIVRTGLDGRQPLTRSQLATVLGSSPAAIGQTERSALGRLKNASRTDGCMPIASASALTAFVGGPFGPIGSLTPSIAPDSRPGAGSSGAPAAFASFSFADGLSSVDGEGQTGPIWAALVIALLLATALTALGREWRRSVY